MSNLDEIYSKFSPFLPLRIAYIVEYHDNIRYRHKHFFGRISPLAPQPTRYWQSFSVIIPLSKKDSYALLADLPLKTSLFVRLSF